MVFADLIFLYSFLPMCLILYCATKNKQVKNAVLIVFSLIFYGWGEPVWVILLILSSIVDFCCGLFIGKHQGNSQAKLGVAFSLVFNLGVLALFKYSGFFVENINLIFNSSIPVPKFALPIGISFYTFQTISYTLDVYKGQVKVQRSLPNFLMFVSLFPQLVAGPIVRYSVVENEISNRRVSSEDFSVGLSRFILGLGKKVIIANTMGALATELIGGKIVSSLSAWAGILAFSIQIYFDFSGYSDMAIGLGRMFGFHFDENFNYPYVSKSISEFWRRWHISLGSFFRDYLYIPLGGNRKHHIRNLIIVWFLTGLWHGASWNFILWGLYFGFFIIIEKIFLGKLLEKIPRFFSHIYSLMIIIFGWVIFYFTDLSRLWECIKAMFLSGKPVSDEITLVAVMEKIFVIIIAIILSSGFPRKLWIKITQKANGSKIQGFLSSVQTIALATILIISSVLLVGETYNPFLYFRF